VARHCTGQQAPRCMTQHTRHWSLGAKLTLAATPFSPLGTDRSLVGANHMAVPGMSLQMRHTKPVVGSI